MFRQRTTAQKPCWMVVFLFACTLAISCEIGVILLRPASSDADAATPASIHPQFAPPIAPYNAATDYEKAKAQRIGIWQEWLAAAEALAQKSQDPEALRIAEFLKNNCVIAACLPEGFQALEKKDVPHVAIYVLPLFDDPTEGDQWQKLYGRSAEAVFFSELQVLTFRADQQRSAVGRGITLLHEGHHAISYWDFIARLGQQGITSEKAQRTKIRAYSQDRQRTLSEERSAHDFERRVLEKAFFPAYAQLIEHEAKYLKNELAAKGRSIQTDNPPKSISSYAALEQFFGPALSRNEVLQRGTITWLHACFSLIETEYAGNAGDRKEKFLETTYREQGLPTFVSP